MPPLTAPFVAFVCGCGLAGLLTGCLDGAETAPDGRDRAGFDAAFDAGELDGGCGGGACDAAAPADPCAAEPGLLVADGLVERPLCASVEDVVWIEAPVGAAVTARIRATVAVSVRLRWPADGGGLEVDQLALAGDTAGELQWIAPAGPVELRAASTGSSTEASAGAGSWRVSATAAPRETMAVEITGQIGGSRRPVTNDGLGEVEPFATEGARVDLLDGAGRLVTASRVGAGGAVRLAGHAPAGEALSLRLVAQTEAAGVAVRVGPDEVLPWAEVVAEVVAGAGGADGGGAGAGGGDDAPAMPIDAALDPAGTTAAAWFITRTAAGGLARLEPLLPAHPAPPAVIYRWRPGFSAACGSCFRPGPAPVIDLGGRISDPDEWDEAVILHELGHHVAAVYSRDDSGGGPHDGGPIEPAVAWSEGFATFHAGFVIGDPIQRDYKVTGVSRIDLEALDDPRAFGTADGTLMGVLSEQLVAAVLWDLSDGGPNDDDLVTLDGPALFAPLFDGIPAAMHDRGAPGVDLADYLDALWCAAPPAGVDAVLAGRDYPYTAPESCRGKAGEPVAVQRRGETLILTAQVAGRLVLRDGGLRSRWVAAGETVQWRARPAGPWVGVELTYRGGRAVVAVEWAPAVVKAAPMLRRRAGAWEVVR